MLALPGAAGAETWTNGPSGALLCLELSRREARAAFVQNRGLAGATFCAAFPAGDAILVLRHRRRPPCLDRGVRRPDGAYAMSGRCGPLAIRTD